MRTLAEVKADLARLSRPLHPGAAAITAPRLLREWRLELAQWTSENPTGSAVYEALLDEWEAIERATVKAQAAERVTRASGLPRRIAGALVRPDMTHALKAAIAWCNGDKRYLVLAGPVGTGKSVAAGAALEWHMLHGRAAAWLSAGSFTAKLGGFDGAAECERMKHLDVMVLDDFGTEHLSAFASSVLHEVLAARHENEGRTVFTTNLDGGQFRARVGSRLEDRIRESVTWVNCVGVSLRGAR